MALASLFNSESLSIKKVAGLIIGFIGVMVVIVGKFGINLGLNGGLSLLNFSFCLISLLAIAIGVFYQKKFCDHSQLLTGTLMQYVAATIATAILAILLNETWQINWTSNFALALSWQVLGLSIGAVVLLMAIIKTGEAEQVSGMFYLVPPLVVIEAHYLFDETLGALSIFGMGLCVFGVYLSNRRPTA